MKGIAGKEDIQFKSSGTTKQTFTRTDASSRTLTLEQIDGAHIQFRTLAKSIDDLVDGGYDVAIKPQYIFGGGTNTVGHTVPDAADDTFVLRDTDETISGKKTFSAIVKLAKGADVASAANMTLGDDGNYFDITGTTGISTIATKGIGTVVRLHFDAVLTITHDATDLILPGGANITTFAGLELELTEYSVGNWRLTAWNYPLIMPPGTTSGLTNWPAFSAYINGGQTNITTSDELEFDTEEFDTNSNFNTSTWRFTPTVPGLYLLTLRVLWISLTAGDNIAIYITKNSTPTKLMSEIADAASQSQIITAIFEANGTDYFRALAQNTDRNTSGVADFAQNTCFQGCRIG